MQEIITWLRSIDLLASKLYLEAACSLDGDHKYSSFLARLSEYESWHYHIIGSAAQYLQENNIREVLSESLKRLGAVTAAADGREGLALLEKNFFNAIVSDIKMPKMGGIEFYRKAVAVNPDISRHFLFVSGDITPEAGAFMQANHLLCLEKPFSLKRISGLVKEIMEKAL